MDRSTIYTGEQGRSVDFLFAQRSTLIALAKVSQAAFGSNTIVRGLAVTPNSPAALNVLVGIGEIYTMAQVDATAWGSLPADTTDVVLQQGINLAAQTISTPAPSTSGFSVVYLIEAQFQPADTNSAVLPYFNSANPQIPLNGQGGNGQPQATQRQGLVVVQAKAGVPAATGTQVAPTVDAGWTALATVTVANGASTVVSGNIAVPAGVPQVSSLLQMMQTGSSSYAIDSSASANTVTVALTPPITSYVDGQPINFQAANTNNGACTINAGGGSVSLTGANGAFQGGEIVAGKFYEAVYRANTGSVVVIGQSGGALQVAPATQSQHALQLGQATGRLLRTSIYTLISGVQNVSVNGGAFTTTGATIFAPLSNTSTVIGEAQGGGGAGGGASGAGASTVSIGAPGGAGSYGKSLWPIATVGASQTITVGAAGAAVGGAAGGNGGSSSIGSLLTAPGGVGGGSVTAVTPPTANGNGSFSTAPTGANLIATRGASVQSSIGFSTTAASSGTGGGSPFGPGATGPGITTNGIAAVNYGTGGSGTVVNQSGGSTTGGAGFAGIVIITEFA